jgi:GH35 family endo-1,4-beta-xylanase
VRRLKTTILLLTLAAALAAPATAAALPRTFFGVAPQTALTEADVAYMKSGHIGSIRWPISWAEVQPTERGGYDWSGIDSTVEVAARHGLTVLPFIYGTPSWLARKPTTLPIDSARARHAWTSFLEAAVRRYGPGGEFWAEHDPATAEINYAAPIPSPMPIRNWQVWNEANFFYFAYPVSPSRYARLLRLSHAAIRSADPSAKVILSGLFGNPDESGKRGMDAVKFLAALYRVRGIKADFDGVALHPYAFHVDVLEELTEEVREVVLENHDAGSGLYITEMGWGSQNDPNVVAFEQGVKGQARELRGAYRYLIGNRHRLDLEGIYWYSWKDNPAYVACSFCDSVGLFRAGRGFKPKPAWHAFVAVTGGRARP